MPFEKGGKPGPGRPVGSTARRAAAFYEAVILLGFDSAKETVDLFKAAKAKFEDPNEPDKDKFLKIALDAVSEINRYSHPIPKIPDQNAADILAKMTPEQKLEALKHATTLIESELGKPKP